MTLPNVPKDANMPEAVRGWLERVKRYIESVVSSIGDLVIPEPATEAEAEAGVVDDKYLSPLTGLAAIAATASLKKFAHYREEQPNNTDGGNPSVASYNVRTLNTEVYDSIGASLSSNRVTLPAGTYFVFALAPGYRIGKSKARIYNFTDSTVLLEGTGDFCAVGSEANHQHAMVFGVFTLSASKEIRVEHFASNNPGSGVGLGTAFNIGETEIYTQLFIWQVS
jgi:hypothetical protein